MNKMYILLFVFIFSDPLVEHSVCAVMLVALFFVIWSNYQLTCERKKLIDHQSESKEIATTADKPKSAVSKQGSTSTSSTQE